MDIPTTPAAAPAPPAAPPAPSEDRYAGDSLGKEVRESFLLLGLSLGLTVGLTLALQAVLSLVG